MNDHHPVLIRSATGEKTYTAEFQTAEAFAKAWQGVLKRSYGNAEVRCNCRGHGEKRLAIKYYGGSDSFSLARFALTGQQHALDCQYFGNDQVPGDDNGGSTGVLDVQRDGSVKIRLEIGVKVKDVMPAPAPVNDASPHGPSLRRPAMKLRGLLDYLWETATINQWRPWFSGARNLQSVFRRVQSAAESVSVGDIKLADLLLLPAMKPGGAEERRNRTNVDQAMQSRRRMLIVAPLAAYTVEREERMVRQLVISAFHGIPPAYFADGQWNLLVKRYATAASLWRAGHPAIAIVQVELGGNRERPSAKVIDVALMSTTRQWIPVDSSYEALIAERLVAQERNFYKPLRYNSDTDSVLPDFVLVDGPNGEIPLEVFGRNDAAYLQRKAEKWLHYDKRYGTAGWWRWDATLPCAATNIPAFPPATRRSAGQGQK
jgi:hypothetical protein